jgi:hypothetical protein
MRHDISTNLMKIGVGEQTIFRYSLRNLRGCYVYITDGRG